MPMRGELQMRDIDPRDRRSAIDDAQPRIIATMANPEFGMIALFCAVGLWLTFYHLHFLSTFGAAARLLAQVQ